MAKEKKIDELFKEPLAILGELNRIHSPSLSLLPSECETYSIQVLRAMNNLLELVKGYQRWESAPVRYVFINNHKKEFISNLDKLNPATWVPLIQDVTTYTIATAFLQVLNTVLSLDKKIYTFIIFEGGRKVLENMKLTLEKSIEESCYHDFDISIHTPKVDLGSQDSKLEQENTYNEKLQKETEQQKQKKLQKFTDDLAELNRKILAENQRLQSIEQQLEFPSSTKRFNFVESQISNINAENAKLLDLIELILKKSDFDKILNYIENNFGLMTLVTDLKLKTPAIEKIIYKNDESNVQKKNLLRRLLSTTSVPKSGRTHRQFFIDQINQQVNSLKEKKKECEKEKIPIQNELVQEINELTLEFNKCKSNIKKFEVEIAKLSHKIEQIKTAKTSYNNSYLQNAIIESKNLQLAMVPITEFIKIANEELKKSFITIEAIDDLTNKLTTFQTSFSKFPEFEGHKKNTVDEMAKLANQLDQKKKSIQAEQEKLQKQEQKLAELKKTFEGINQKLSDKGVGFQLNTSGRGRLSDQLDNYWKEKFNSYLTYRNHHYRIRDMLGCCFFNNRERREVYLLELRALIANYNGDPKKFEKIQAKITAGLTEFKSSKWTDKKDQFKHLNGLLQNLQECMNVIGTEWPGIKF